MQKNENTIDRAVRVVVAVVAVVAAFVLGFGSVWSWLLLAVGAVMLVTAAVGFCPLYRVLGLSTLRGAAPAKNTGAKAAA